MDTITSPTNPLISTSTPVFGDNVQGLLGERTLQLNPTGIIVVNSTNDTIEDPNSGVTTLRDAIVRANADEGEDLIVFDRSLFSTAQTITLKLGELNITHSLDIIAPRDSLTGSDLVTVSGNQASRVFEIGTGAAVNIDGLIVADGQVAGDNGGGILNSGILTLDNSIVRNNSVTGIMVDAGNGGGIYNSGTLTVNNSTISGNSVTLNSGGIGGNGGGIYNSSGSLEVNNSTISGNRANTLRGSGSGGGIYNANAGNLTVSNSTLGGNSAGSGAGGGIYNNGTSTVSNSTLNSNIAFLGAGIYNNGTSTVSNSTLNSNSAFLGAGIYNYNNSTLEVRNSTLSSNSALQQGGGIYNGGTLTLVFSTLTLNKAGMSGGGIYGTASVRNTIIAQNQKDAVNINIDVSGTFSSNGYNLIGDSTGSIGFGVTGDIVGSSSSPIDPRLDTLAFNGGSTQTIALLPDSPAIGAADPIVLDTDPTTDQRGLPRRAADGSADIGAYELS